MNNLIVKSFTTTKNGDNIKSVTYLDDNGVEVTISSASMLHGSATLQSNGTYNFDDGEYAGVKTVVVNVETQGTIKEKKYNVILNRDAQDIQITSDITTTDNYDEEVNTGKVNIPDSRLTSKEANLSKSENVTVLPDHYGLSSVVVPPVDSRLILKDETLTGTQRRSNSCDMTNLVGQYGSEAGWVEVPIESNPNNQKYGYEAIFLPNTRLEYKYITREEINDWISSGDRLVINPAPGMFGLSSVVLPKTGGGTILPISNNKNIIVNDLPIIVNCEDELYAGTKQVSLSAGEYLKQDKQEEVTFYNTNEYTATPDSDYYSLNSVTLKLKDFCMRKLSLYSSQDTQRGSLLISYPSGNKSYTLKRFFIVLFDENFTEISLEDARDKLENDELFFVLTGMYAENNTENINIKQILYPSGKESVPIVSKIINDPNFAYKTGEITSIYYTSSVLGNRLEFVFYTNFEHFTNIRIIAQAYDLTGATSSNDRNILSTMSMLFFI